MTASMETKAQDVTPITWAGGRLSLSQLKRAVSLRILFSLVAVWAASHFIARAPDSTDSFSPALGVDIPRDRKYGLNTEKLAIVFEPLHRPHSAFHLLHTVNVLPADWPVLYVGTPKAIELLNESYPVQIAQEKGRLTLQEAPKWINFAGHDALQRLFAMSAFYNSLPSGVEHLFISGMDSIMCSASLSTMDDWLEFDFVGSPWNGNSWTDGHNGHNGYSLRKVSSAKEAIRSFSRTLGNPVDWDLRDAMQERPKAKLPTEKAESFFVMESEWVERPMAYHPYTKDLKDHEGWATENYRRAIWEHCPELKVVMQMKLDREKCTAERMAQDAEFKANEEKRKQEKLEKQEGKAKEKEEAKAKEEGQADAVTEPKVDAEGAKAADQTDTQHETAEAAADTHESAPPPKQAAKEDDYTY